MDKISPVSVTLTIETTPSVRLYDSRSTLLERVGDVGLTDRFLVNNDRVSVILDGPRELRVTLTEVSLTSFVPTADDSLAQILEGVDSVLQPHATSISVGVQHLIPVSENYEEARAAIGRGLLGRFVASTGLTDFALLFDGHDKKADVNYQAEFGVVSADEAPLRLGRYLGRISGRRESPLIGHLMEQHYSDVSLFCDSTWHPELPDTVDFSTHALLTARHISECANSMVGAICRAVSLQDGLEAHS